MAGLTPVAVLAEVACVSIAQLILLLKAHPFDGAACEFLVPLLRNTLSLDSTSPTATYCPSKGYSRTLSRGERVSAGHMTRERRRTGAYPYTAHCAGARPAKQHNQSSNVTTEIRYHATVLGGGTVNKAPDPP